MAPPQGHHPSLVECLGIYTWLHSGLGHFFELTAAQLTGSQPPPPSPTAGLSPGLPHSTAGILSCV